MSHTAAPDRRAILALDGLAVAAIYCAAWWATRTAVYAQNAATFGPAIWIDLVVTAAGVHYFVGIRKGGLPAWTLFPLVAIGFWVAGMLAPQVSEDAATLFLVAAGLLEVGVAVLILWRLTRLTGAYRRARARGDSFLAAAEAALEGVLGMRWLAAAVRMELEIIALALLGWFRRRVTPPGVEDFTVHRKVSWFLVVSVLAVFSVMEGGLLHFLLWSWGYSVLALVMTGLHFYGLLWLAGDAHAMRLYPIEVNGKQLRIRIGLRWRARIERSLIEQASAAPATIARSDGALKLAVFGSPDVLLTLKHEAEVRGLFGLRRRCRLLALAVDEPDRFLAVLNRDPGVSR